MEKVIVLRKVKNPVISVIIPTLNEEKYIENTLLSLKWQNFNLPYEIIVSDSNSKDKTVEIAKKYADIIVISNKKGVSAGRNLGAKVARGNLLVFIDADTILLPNTLKNIYDFFKKNKEYVGLNVVILTDNLKYNFHFLMASYIYILLMKLNLQPIYTVCFACRRKHFWKVGGFDENLHLTEDVELGQRLKKLGKMGYLTETFAITSSRRIKKWGAIKTVLKWPLSYFLIKTLNKQPSYEPIR